MYYDHFALRDEPFGVTPDLRFFLETEQHREAFASLYYCIKQRRGFTLLTGGAGLGKTSVLVQLLNRLAGEAETAFLPHPYFDASTVVESVLSSLGLRVMSSAADSHCLFYEYLVKTHRIGRTCVVVFDEAQNLSRDTLEAIRMLSNFETQSEKLVQIILSGQTSLAEALKRPDYEQLRQRINIFARLNPLTGGEVREYMDHRLRLAGASIDLFTLEAQESIILASGGVPRNVNTICFNSLTLAYALNSSRVGYEEVAEVLRDLDLGLADAAGPGAISPTTEFCEMPTPLRETKFRGAAFSRRSNVPSRS
jgi:general secretion pathway protein A